MAKARLTLRNKIYRGLYHPGIAQNAVVAQAARGV
jgi:hypothetical protein